ncbi:MAG: hypothetical protein ACE5HB_07735, partial [Terriglobia bacterium]
PANETFANEFDQRLRDQVKQAGGDGTIAATVHFGADGSVAVQQATTSGSLAGPIDTSEVARYLRGRGYAYKKRDGSGAAQAAEQTVAVIIAVDDTAPYIWLARGEIIAFTLIFLVMISVAWRRRSAAAEAAS